MNRTGTPTRTERRGYSASRVPRDHYQDVTDRIIAALEAGTPPWRRPWDPDKAGGRRCRATRRPVTATGE